jgi:hypothetical protein
VPDPLEIRISLVYYGQLCSGIKTNWGLGGDEDPLPPNGGNLHPLPNFPFGGIRDDMMHEDNNAQGNVAADMCEMSHLLLMGSLWFTLHHMILMILKRKSKIFNLQLKPWILSLPLII